MAQAHPDPLLVPAGEWHMYRRDHHLTGRSPMPGRISRPSVRWTFPINGSENECVPIPSDGGRMDLLFAYGGCVVRTDGGGRTVWKSEGYGVNAIGAVEDLDGDGRLEIVGSTGYEVIVLAAESGRLLLRHYVGFPISAGTQASTLLCHRFDRNSRGMHLIVPLMSAKEVLVFDFREGRREVRFPHCQRHADHRLDLGRATGAGKGHGAVEGVGVGERQMGQSIATGAGGQLRNGWRRAEQGEVRVDFQVGETHWLLGRR